MLYFLHRLFASGTSRAIISPDIHHVVGVAQSVEHLVVAQVVGGSSPLAHPISNSFYP